MISGCSWLDAIHEQYHLKLNNGLLCQNLYAASTLMHVLPLLVKALYLFSTHTSICVMLCAFAIVPKVLAIK